MRKRNRWLSRRTGRAVRGGPHFRHRAGRGEIEYTAHGVLAMFATGRSADLPRSRRSGSLSLVALGATVLCAASCTREADHSAFPQPTEVRAAPTSGANGAATRPEDRGYPFPGSAVPDARPSDAHSPAQTPLETPTEAASLPPEAGYRGAEADVLRWMSRDRDPRVERSFVVPASDFVDVWVDSPEYGDQQLLFGVLSGGSTLIPDQVALLGLDDDPVIVVEATTRGIDLWSARSQGDDRLWYCVPTQESERQRIVAFIHGETGELIGAAPLPVSNLPEALEALRQRGSSYGAGASSMAARPPVPDPRSDAGVAGSTDGSPTYEATHVVNNVFWSTKYIGDEDLNLDDEGDAYLLEPVLAALDDADGLTPADRDAVVIPHLVTAERVQVVNSRAGSFGDCWLVTTVIGGGNTAATWYCAGPGIVRREVPGCGSGNPYGSYSVYELVDWNVADP